MTVTLLVSGGLVETYAASEPSDTCFRIDMDGERVGQDCLVFRRTDGALYVRRSILIEVSYAGLTVYRYRHEGRERWRDDRLQFLESWTDDNGRRFHVRAKRDGNGLRVDNGDSDYSVRGEVIPTSYWNAELVNQSRLLDTQKGILRDIDVSDRGTMELSIPTGSTTVDVYQLSDELTLQVGYGSGDQWRWLQFERSGYTFEYRLTSPEPGSWRDHPFYDRSVNLD